MKRYWPYLVVVAALALFALVLKVTWYNSSWWVRRAVAKWNGTIEPLEDGDALVSWGRHAYRMSYLVKRPLKTLRLLYEMGYLPDQSEATDE